MPIGRRRRAALRMAARLVRDESGGALLEYALIGGIIVAGAIGMIACVGGKVVGRWTSLNSSS